MAGPCRSVVASPLRIEAAGGSHVGEVRANNEDSFAVLPEIGLFMVADGIGGQAAGEIASRMAVDIVRSCIEEDDPDETWPYERNMEADRDEARLVWSLRRANREIEAEGRRIAGKRGRGSTFAGALVSGERVDLAHVGDSRIYRLRRGRLAALTRDHTVLEELLRQQAGADPGACDLAPEIACRLTRALGIDRAVDVETRVEAAEAGDVLLLCSDGLWGPVDEDEIAATLAWSASIPAVVAGLIGRALEHGGPDNVTCVVVRFGAW
ncbi:MAG: serine/threonine-protein phosphatase [Polyangiaceae bacterium]|nr:serine/threonine-protein phosphatase [Polyangiaceae bacterium]